MRLLVAIAVIVIVGLVALVVWFGSPKGPRLEQVAYLREPRIATLPPLKVLLVTAKGDPNKVGKRAFGLLMRTYFGLEGVPKGGPAFKPPRARWPVDPDTPVEQWTGLYAIPLPETVTALPARSEEHGLTLELSTWEYGEVAEVLHVGAYDQETPTVERLRSFIASRGYEIAGLHEEEYLKGPGMIFAGDPADYLTIIRYPVRQRSEAALPPGSD